MKAKRPTSIRVGWATFQVIWVPKAEWPKRERDKVGLTWPAQGEIWLREYDDATEQWYREILIHEALHVAHFVSGLGQHPKAPKRSEGEQEEWVTTLLAGPMLSFMQDNPIAAAWIAG